jgi:hypothetical protein
LTFGLVGEVAGEADRCLGHGPALPVLETDVRKVRLATACQQAGLPMDGIAAAIRAGRLSFAFLEAAPYRVGRGYAEGLRLIAQVEIELWQARFVAPLLAAGADQQTAQELAWTESLVEDIEAALEDTGVLGRPGRVPAMCFLDLVGYTRLTEEQGDQAAAELAGRLAVLVGWSSREHGGVPVKWLGDG